MAGSFDDPWVTSNSSISAERLHALGVITFKWNLCEFWLFHLFRAVSALPESEAWILSYDLKSQPICARIKLLMKQRNYHSDLIELIDNVILFSDKCRDNRNAVVHAWTYGMRNGEKVLARKSRKPSEMDPIPFQSELLDLRRVADEIETAVTRLWLITCVIEDGSSGLPQPRFQTLILSSSLTYNAGQPKTKTPDAPI